VPRPEADPPALLLGDDPVNTLGVARNLGRAGVRVYRLGAADVPVLRSRYVRAAWVEKGIDDGPDSEFVEVLERSARATGGTPVLFPLSDLHVLRVARNASALGNSCLLLAASVEATETLVNKRRFYESLARAGIPHPTTRYPDSRESYAAAADELGYPVLIKPEISPLFARAFRRKGFVARDRDELLRHMEPLEASGLRVMVQELIPGGADCMHGCAGFRGGGAALVFCYRRIREYPPGTGCGSLLVGVPSFADRTRLLEYLDGIGYTGIFDAEFKLDPRDGVFKMIEINARSWWQNLLPTVSGINVIKAAYDHASGRPVQAATYRPGAKWIHLYNDYHASRGAGMGLLAWLQSLRGASAYDVLAADDMGPMLWYLSDLVLRKLRVRRDG
jgi:predicted ATP-grasp superfamily ATP-dependent carboligase